MRRGLTLLVPVLLVALASFPVKAAGGPRPLGTYAVTAVIDITCPAGSACRSFKVTCPDVLTTIKGFLAVAEPTSAPRGAIVVFAGGRGTAWWSAKGTSWAQSIVDWQADGFRVVQVRWASGWFASAKGERAGVAALACRPATVLQWVRDQLYVPMGITPTTAGSCGFCATGWSGGSSAPVYAITHYGLGSIIDAIVPVSGPTHGNIAKGCLRNTGEEKYWYVSTAREQDASYGFSKDGPCQLHDPAWADHWNADSLATSAIQALFTATRIDTVIGGSDKGPAPAQAKAVTDLLITAGSPMITREVIAGMGHAPDAAGFAALRAALNV